MVSSWRRASPSAREQRHRRRRDETIHIALELASRVDELVFGPVIAARRHLDDGRLVEVAVADWGSTEPLLLACNPERLLSRDHAAIVAALQQRLDELR